MRDVEARIEHEVIRLANMEKHCEAIRTSAGRASGEIEKSQKALGVLLRKAQSTLRALNVELTDEAAERGSPIALPAQAEAVDDGEAA